MRRKRVVLLGVMLLGMTSAGARAQTPDVGGRYVAGLDLALRGQVPFGSGTETHPASIGGVLRLNLLGERMGMTAGTSFGTAPEVIVDGQPLRINRVTGDAGLRVRGRAIGDLEGVLDLGVLVAASIVHAPSDTVFHMDLGGRAAVSLFLTDGTFSPFLGLYVEATQPGDIRFDAGFGSRTTQLPWLWAGAMAGVGGRFPFKL